MMTDSPSLSNLKKILFQPAASTRMLLSEDEWDAIDLGDLESPTMFSIRDLRIAAMNRALDPAGPRPYVITRLVNSVMEQRGREGRERHAESERANTTTVIADLCKFATMPSEHFRR